MTRNKTFLIVQSVFCALIAGLLAAAALQQRQAEGIAAAKARGVQFGRHPREKPENYNTVLEQWQEGEITAHRAALFLGVDRKTFLKWVS